MSKAQELTDAFYKAYKKPLPLWRILFCSFKSNQKWYDKRIKIRLTDTGAFYTPCDGTNIKSHHLLIDDKIPSLPQPEPLTAQSIAEEINSFGGPDAPGLETWKIVEMIETLLNQKSDQAHGFTESDLERLRLAGITGDKDGTKFRALYDHIRIYKKYSGQSMDQTMGDVIKLTNGFVEFEKENTKEPEFPKDQVIHEHKPPPPLPPPKRSIIEGKQPPQKPTKDMTKYRILEIPQPDGSNKYRVKRRKLESDSWWKFNNKTVESWDKIVIDHKYIGVGLPLILIYLPDFATEKEAKAYIEFLGRKSKVVFETEV